MTEGMNIEKVKELDSRYTNYEAEGFHFWNSYNTKPEAEQAVRNLHRWGNKVRIVIYPNGVYVVMRKEGYRKE
jgi:hypothetical protein